MTNTASVIAMRDGREPGNAFGAPHGGEFDASRRSRTTTMQDARSCNGPTS